MWVILPSCRSRNSSVYLRKNLQSEAKQFPFVEGDASVGETTVVKKFLRPYFGVQWSCDKCQPGTKWPHFVCVRVCVCACTCTVMLPIEVLFCTVCGLHSLLLPLSTWK